VLLIRNHSRIKDDAAMGIVLSVFFGAGVAVLSVAQSMPEGSAAGLESFIYGKTASMVLGDFQMLTAVTGCVLLLSVLLFKEFRLLCFDESFAAAQGWPVRWLDGLLLALVTLVTVAGLQAVGLILIIAFLITPAAAARFWTERLDNMLILSAAIGALSGWLGASISAFFPRMPAGAVIVLVAAGCFLFSMLLGKERGVLVRLYRQACLKRNIGRQHLLRALYEIIEADAEDAQEVTIRPVAFRQVRGRRTWYDAKLKRYMRQAYQDGLIRESAGETITLTDVGLDQAAKVTRNHRLWEMYLIEYADIATSRVDRDADAVEHILGERMVATLETKLMQLRDAGQPGVPASPHPIRPVD
jgi:manganese/zinc/iron transport system permease protein